MSDALTEVASFDALAPGAAGELLRPSCASRTWISAMVAAHPYGSLAALVERSDEVLAALTWPDLAEALAAHPRIGERASGEDREPAWSRQEQSGAAAVESEVADSLHRGNVEYEQRFGHVFLICATGRSSEQMLASLRKRLGNDETAEREVVRAELTAIVALRLGKTFR